jgi:hypothetical protein
VVPASFVTLPRAVLLASVTASVLTVAIGSPGTVLAQTPPPPASAPLLVPAPPAPSPAEPPAVPAPAPAPLPATGQAASPAPVYYPYSYSQAPTGQLGPGYGGPVAAPLYASVIESEGQPVPPGYRLERRPRGGLVLAGVGVFAPFFAFSLTAAIAGHSEKDRWLFLPVVGPGLDLLARRNCADGTYDSACKGPQALLQFALLGQVAGAALFAAGFLAQREVFVRNDPTSARRLPFVVAPTYGADSSGRPGTAPGLTALGQF